MTGLDPSADFQRPTMAAAFPEATTQVVRVLRQMGYTNLADSRPSQRFYGQCHCKSGCSFVLTAPPDSTGTLMVWLEVEGEIIGEASLDSHGRIITNFDIVDPENLGIPSNWFERGLSSVASNHEDR
jgi:hypothetical protein